MKHIAQSIIIIGLFFIWWAFAQSNLNTWIDSLSAKTPFGYTTLEKIWIWSITSQEATITSPFIIDELWGKIKKYTIMYSQHPIDDMLNNTDLLNQAKEKTFDFIGTETWINMKLNISDGIDPTKIYYILVMPKDSSWIWWDISNQIRFKLSDQTYWEWLATWNQVHSASVWADMSLANISHTCNPDCQINHIWSKKINLTWISVPWSDKIDLSMVNDWTTNFSSLSTVNMSTEKYELQTNINWEHVFKFTPNNWWKEVTYTVNIAGINTPQPTPVVTWSINKVPVTWPRENTIVILVITILGYYIYRKVYKRA